MKSCLSDIESLHLKKQKMKNLSQKRGEIIEKFMNIELIISCIIARNYAPKENGINKTFLTDVLYDEYFHCGLKIRILEKIVEDSILIQELRRLNKIRNIFAHSGHTILTKLEIGKLREKKVNLSRSIEQNPDYQKLYNEFRKKQKTCSEKLSDILRNGGCQLYSRNEILKK